MQPKIVHSCILDYLGGWTLDDGYLLAHGLGMPVEDARGSVYMEGLRSLKVWIKTRDWVSPRGPGRFQVLINGVAIAKSFGEGSGEWHWEDGGLVTLKKGENEIRLHDLTGFDGRCAAIAFADPDEIPSEVWGQLPEPTSTRDFDLVVVGGGYAGMCAAVAAARCGTKVALIQDRPVWGGNASCEVRVGPIGRLGLGPFPKNSDLAYELWELTHVEGRSTSGGLRPLVDDGRLKAWLGAEENLTLFNCTKLVDCETTVSDQSPYEQKIVSVSCHQWRTDVVLKLTACQFVDATGDAVLARLAKAEVRVKPEAGESLKGGYGSTNFWTTRWTDRETAFPSCPWALAIDETNWQVNRPKFFVEGDFPYAAGWNWESGFDKDPIKDAEAIRDLNFRAAYGMWDYLKNKAPDKARYAKAEMDWLGYVLGKRAAVRIVGDYVLTEQDLVEHREYPDGVVTTSWFLDLHAPHPMNEKAFPGESFRSIAYDDPKYHELVPGGEGRQISIKPYAIPFRCFYSRNIENLWMAGKDISCTHVAMSSVRVENTTAQMGAMVGRAVTVCLQKGWSPRELGRHWDCLEQALKEGTLTLLARRGRRRVQQRLTIKGEIKYWLRPMWRWLRRV